MDIRTLITNNRLDRNSSASKVTAKSDINTHKNHDNGDIAGRSDTLSITTATASDLDFARQVYKKLDETSFERVRSIRMKAEQGYYTSDESIKKIAQGLSLDLAEIETDALKPAYVPTYPIDVEKLKQNLAENSEIIAEVASRLSKILTKL